MQLLGCFVIFLMISENDSWKDFGLNSDKWPLSTACGGTLTGKGRIQSPNFPGIFPSNTKCVWKYESEYLDSLFRGEFTIFHMHENCTSSVKIVKIEHSKQFTLIRCGKTIPQPIRIGPQSSVVIELTANGDHQSFGFSLSYETIRCGMETLTGHRKHGEWSSPFYPEQTPNHLKCETGLYLVQAGSTLQFNIPSIDLEHTATKCIDFIEISTFKDDTPVEDDIHFCGINGIMEVVMSVSNKVIIVYHRADASESSGWYAPYDIDTCGGDLINASEGTLTSSYYPDFYGYDRECIYYIIGPKDSRVLLRFREFIMRVNDPILNNYVKIESVDDSRAVVTNHGTFVKDDLPPDIVSATNTLRFTFKSTSMIKTKLFYSKFYVISCNDTTYTAETGTIASPRYPECYIADIKCVWNINTDTKYYGISIEFNTFRVGDKKKSVCHDDKLIVQDMVGERPRNVQEYCGYYKPKHTIVMSNRVKIIFSPVTTLEHIGFSLTYRTLTHEEIAMTTVPQPNKIPCKSYLPMICLDIKCKKKCPSIKDDHFYLEPCKDIELFYDTPFKRFTTMYFCDEIVKNMTIPYYFNGCSISKLILNFCRFTKAEVIIVGKISDDCAVCYKNECK